MNRDDIIRLAREADIDCDLIDEDEGQVWYITTETLERFAALVAAAEREECEKACEEEAMRCEAEAERAEPDEVDAIRATAWKIKVCAAAIRARGEK